MNPTLEQQCKERFEDFASSGLSKRAFCRNKDLPYHQFCYWMKKFQNSTPVTPSPVQWMTLDVTPAETWSSSPTPIRLRAGGVTIEVNEGFSEALLRQVLKALTGK